MICVVTLVRVGETPDIDERVIAVGVCEMFEDPRLRLCACGYICYVEVFYLSLEGPCRWDVGIQACEHSNPKEFPVTGRPQQQRLISSSPRPTPEGYKIGESRRDAVRRVRNEH